MNKGSTFVMMFVTLILGFMLYVQFQTTNQPNERDTRDIWELRGDLDKVKKQQIALNEEIRQYHLLLNQYQQNSDQEKIKAMEEALENLQEEVGLTEITGEGVILTIEPLFSEDLLGKEVPKLTPELLIRLVNQLNSYEIETISVFDQRVVTTSAIREVNGKTYVNNRPLPDLPITIKVIAKDAKKLFDQIKASEIIDDFAKVDLLVSSQYKRQIEVPAYEHHLTVKYMEQVKEDS